MPCRRGTSRLAAGRGRTANSELPADHAVDRIAPAALEEDAPAGRPRDWLECQRARECATDENGHHWAFEDGEGTTIKIYLPRVHLAAEEAEYKSEQNIARGLAETVLVVEDEPAVRAVVVRSLNGGGFRVLQAPDGATALQVVDKEGRPDLVLTDLMMPGIGGTELARRLKARWQDLPILYMSGYSAEDLHRQGAAVPEGVMIQKPLRPDALLRSVHAALVART